MIINAEFNEVNKVLDANFGALTRGEKGDKGDKGDAGEVTLEYANTTFAPVVACESSVDVIVLNDASERDFNSLKVYGKTTQADTPSPDNPQELINVCDGGQLNVDVHGKSLYDFVGVIGEGYTNEKNGLKVVVKDGYANVTGTCSDVTNIIPVTNTPSGVSPILPAGIYCTHSRLNVGVAVKENGKWVDKANKSGTFTMDVPFRISYFFVAYYKGMTYETPIPLMLVAGSKLGSYEEYKTRQRLSIPNCTLAGIPVTKNGNYTDANGQAWICDEIDFARGVYIQRIRACELKKINWEMDGTEEANDWKFGINVGEKSINKAIMCKQFPLMTNVANGHKNGCGINIWVNGYLEIVSTTHTTAEAFNEWNRNNPINILYALAEPIETPLDEATLSAFSGLHTNKPNTTIITSVGAEMSTEYIADTKLYIDNKFAELQALILEG